jgi:hypothetical protein
LNLTLSNALTNLHKVFCKLHLAGFIVSQGRPQLVAVALKAGSKRHGIHCRQRG